MDRREFIKTAAGTFFIASAGAAFGADAASNRVRFALIGCRKGGRGEALLGNALLAAGSECVCVCDVDTRAMDYAAELVRTRTGKLPRKERDFRKVLEMADVDAVISATPDHFHAYSAIMAMRAGKNVYVEKPCAFCPRECELIVDTWKKTGKVFQMGSQRRATPSFISAIEEIRQGALIGEPKYAKTWYMSRRKPIGKGRVVTPPEWLDWDLWQGPAPRVDFRDNLVPYNWHWFFNWGTGEAGNNAVHMLDIARWCLGEEEAPAHIVSSGGRFWIPADTDWEWPDTQNCAWTYRSGKSIVWEGLSCASQKPYLGIGGGTVVYAQNGVAFFRFNGSVEVTDADGKVLKTWDPPKAIKSQVTTGDRAGGVGTTDPTCMHFANFFDAIRANNPRMAFANAEIATKSTMLALVANISQRTQQAIRLDPATWRPVGDVAMPLWARDYAKGWELV